jgi:hypothetical protein
MWRRSRLWRWQRRQMINDHLDGTLYGRSSLMLASEEKVNCVCVRVVCVRCHIRIRIRRQDPRKQIPSNFIMPGDHTLRGDYPHMRRTRTHTHNTNTRPLCTMLHTSCGLSLTSCVQTTTNTIIPTHPLVPTHARSTTTTCVDTSHPPTHRRCRAGRPTGRPATWECWSSRAWSTAVCLTAPR